MSFLSLVLLITSTSILPVLASDPRGWRYDGQLPFTQVSNISEWHHNIYYADLYNYIGLVDQFVRGPEQFFMSVSYQDRDSYNVNYTSVYTDIYFSVNTDACFTADMSWTTVPHRSYPTEPPYIAVWYSITDITNNPWAYSWLYDVEVTEKMQVTFSPHLCKQPFTGRVRLSLEYSMTPINNNFPFGSGSHVQLSNPQVVLGKCVDKTNELIVLLSVLGSFVLTLALLAIFLFCYLQKKHKEGKPFVALAAWWHLFNIAAHTMFAWSMKNRNFSVAYALSIFFLAAPLVLQLVSACLGMATELRRADFSVWYYRHRIVCNLLGTAMPLLGMHTLALMHSRLGGFSGFSAPFSVSAIKSIKFSLLLSAFMQDLPQFIIQIVMYQAAQEVNPIIIVSLITALSTLLYRIGIWGRHTYINWGVGKSGILQSSIGATLGDWVELWDSETGRWYYENTRTHVTTWDKPQEFTASTAELTKPMSETLIHAIISRKRIVFSSLAAVVFFGLGMATRFHLQLDTDVVSS